MTTKYSVKAFNWEDVKGSEYIIQNQLHQENWKPKKNTNKNFPPKEIMHKRRVLTLVERNLTWSNAKAKRKEFAAYGAFITKNTPEEKLKIIQLSEPV